MFVLFSLPLFHRWCFDINICLFHLVLSQEIADGVSKSTQAVQAAEAGIRQIGAVARQQTICTLELQLFFFYLKQFPPPKFSLLNPKSPFQFCFWLLILFPFPILRTVMFVWYSNDSRESEPAHHLFATCCCWSCKEDFSCCWPSDKDLHEYDLSGGVQLREWRRQWNW